MDAAGQVTTSGFGMLHKDVAYPVPIDESDRPGSN